MGTHYQHSSAKEIAALRSFIKSFDEARGGYMLATENLLEAEKAYKKSYLSCKEAYEECVLYAELVTEQGGTINEELKGPKTPLIDFSPLQLQPETKQERLNDDENPNGEENNDSDESTIEGRSGRQRRRGVRHRLKDYINSSGFFLSSNQILDIVESEYGTTPSSTVTGGLSELTKDGILNRFPSSEGFMYGLPEWFDENDQPMPIFDKSNLEPVKHEGIGNARLFN